MEVKRDILWRVYISFLGITLLSLLVLGRAFYIQKFQGKYWRSMSDSLHQRFIPLAAERGTIYSEDGQMLSTSIPTFDIYMDFNADGLREKKGKRFYENLDSFAISLSNYFGDKTWQEYKKQLLFAYKNDERHYPLKKKLSFDDYKVFREFPLARLGRNKSGVIVEVNTKRLTPFKLLANRTIGLSREFIASNGKTKKQNVGLERSYDSVLNGHDGQRLVRYIAGGTAIPVEGSETDPVNGKDIFTTLDVNIQDITETALMKMMLQCKGPYGTAIVMETQTGKIKAMANLGQQKDGSYWEDDNYALRATEPGSTIKLATLLSVLEKGTSSLGDVVEIGSAGKAQVGNKIVTDAERSPRPILTVQGCFAHSSNIGMSKLALKAFGQKPAEYKEYLHRFHLDVRSPIDLTDVPKPMMAPLDQKGSSEGNLLWMSFGYGIQVSPLHTLTLYNTIANDGKMVKPYLVNSIQKDGIVIKQFQPTVLDERICKTSVVNDARASMRMVVTEGTARKVFAGMPFAIAGKTGTAHVSDGKIKYDDAVYQATFVGYFPADKPQYTCIVVIRTRPHDPIHFGGLLAAPVFREIAIRIYSMYVEKKNPSLYAAVKDSNAYFYAGMAKDIKTVFNSMSVSYTDSVAQNTWANVYAADYKPVMKTNEIRQRVMPNVRGMGLKDAVYLLENMGVKISAKGKGKIISQSVAPGSLLAKGITVMLELS
ncbi:MAG: transpeptidase family protein [Sphingobacteriales bacterium]|nr:transpeptidase family protein [Sphingobacteriales bacterium]